MIQRVPRKLSLFSLSLMSYLTVVHLSQLRKQHWYSTILIKLQTIRISPGFPLMSFFWFQDPFQDTTLHLVISP